VSLSGILVHNNGCADIALAFRNHLDDFAKGRNAATFRDWQGLGLTQFDAQNVRYFPQAFQESAKNARHIHFNLKDFKVMDAVKDSSNWRFGGPLGTNATNMEFRLVWENAELLKKTTFYVDGKVWFHGADILRGGTIPLSP
jgi:hypothetical protein